MYHQRARPRSRIEQIERRAVAAQGQHPSQSETQSSWCSRCNAGRHLWKLWHVDCSAKSQGLGNSYYMSKCPKKSWNSGRESAQGWSHCRKTSRPMSKTAMTERIAQGMDTELPCALVGNPHTANPQRWDTPTYAHTCVHPHIHTHAWAHTPHIYTHRGPRAWRQRLLLIFKSWTLSPFLSFLFLLLWSRDVCPVSTPPLWYIWSYLLAAQLSQNKSYLQNSDHSCYLEEVLTNWAAKTGLSSSCSYADRNAVRSEHPVFINHIPSRSGGSRWQLYFNALGSSKKPLPHIPVSTPNKVHWFNKLGGKTYLPVSPICD